jgi:hypothetical protein
MAMDSEGSNTNRRGRESKNHWALRIAGWLFVVTYMHMVGINMVRFDRAQILGELPPSLVWNIFWFLWTPLNALAWSIMLLGGPVSRAARMGPTIRAVGWVIAIGYWLAILGIWGWVVSQGTI